MFRYLPFAAVALALFFLLASPVVAAQAVHKGKVVSTSDGKIGIRDQDGEIEEFAVTKDCKITLNGKPVELEALSQGNVVKVTTKKEDGKEVAVAIEAKSE